MKRTMIALLCALAVAGCAPLRVQDVDSEGALSVRILADSTRIFRPGMRRRRFRLRIRNESTEPIAFEGLRVVLFASPVGNPDYRALEGNWRYPLEMTLAPGKHAVVPLTPEPHEFLLEQLPKGEFDVRAWIGGGFVSDPFRVRVVRPEMR